MSRTVDEEKPPFDQSHAPKACKASSFDLAALAEAATRSGNLAIPLEAYLRHMLDFEAALARAEAANGAG